MPRFMVTRRRLAQAGDAAAAADTAGPTSTWDCCTDL